MMTSTMYYLLYHHRLFSPPSPLPPIQTDLYNYFLNEVSAKNGALPVLRTPPDPNTNG
jgi:hypothetical protein